MKFKFLLTFICIFLFHINFSYAEILKDIDIKGNSRISKETILNIISFKKEKNYTINEINQFQKKLFESGFFKDIKIKIDSNKLNIFVIENPIISFFYINGVKNKEREDFFYDNLNLGQNKIYSDSLLKADLDKIQDIYKFFGYLDIKVKPNVSLLDNGNINLIIDVERGEKYSVNRIFFLGNKYFSNSTLRDVISSSEYGWWKFLSTTTTLNKDRIENDKKLLIDFYKNEGFANVQIPSLEINIKKKSLANIVFTINSGLMHTFSKINVDDPGNMLSEKNKREILEYINKIINGNYSKQKLFKVKNYIYEYLKKNNIQFVNLDIFEEIQTSEKVNVKFLFKKSKRLIVNLIEIKGNTITEEKVIRDKLQLVEGDNFINYKLDKSIDLLKSSGLFKSVKYKQDNKSEELIDLDIYVEEQPTGSVSAGIGIGSAGSSIQTGIEEKNLFGKGIKINSTIAVGTEKILGNSTISIPDILNTGNTLNSSYFIRSTDYVNVGYESKMIGTSQSIGYDIFEDIYLIPGIGIDTDTIDVKSATSPFKNREGDYLSTKLFYNISKDKRNRKFQTTEGSLINFGQVLSTPAISDVPFLKNYVNGSFYHSLSKKITLNAKLGASAINGLDSSDIKLSDRLFLSNKNLRGFESMGVGPKEGNDHIGGNYSAYANFSSTFPNPLPEKWNANSIFFFDIGNVWGVDYTTSADDSKIRSSTGVALDWISPLGPLSITLAKPLSKSDGDLTESFNFTLGTSF